MSSRPNDPARNERNLEDILGATRRGVSERLADPYLNDHDRWVLRQFFAFLSGIAPEPDPRAPRICDLEHLHRAHVHARYR